MNLDELVVSTKSKTDNVATVILSGKLNLEEHVHFLRRANHPASFPLIFTGALTNYVDCLEVKLYHIFVSDFEKESIGLGKDVKNVSCKDIWPPTKGIAKIVQLCVLPYMFKSDSEAIKGGNNIWTMLFVQLLSHTLWDPSSAYIHDSPYLKNRKGGDSSGYVKYETTPQMDHYFEPCGILGRCWQLVEADDILQGFYLNQQPPPRKH